MRPSILHTIKVLTKDKLVKMMNKKLKQHLHPWNQNPQKFNTTRRNYPKITNNKISMYCHHMTQEQTVHMPVGYNPGIKCNKYKYWPTKWKTHSTAKATHLGYNSSSNVYQIHHQWIQKLISSKHLLAMYSASISIK